jgi:hypothetical protein
MNRYVADTHTLFWYLTASPRLGSQAKQAFHDRIIVGVARRLGAACLSLDPYIVDSGLAQVVW